MAANKDSFKILHTVSLSPGKIVLTDKFRGRHKPVKDDEVIVLADTIRREGQQQPLQVRQVKGTDTYEAIFGNTRQRAGSLIQTGYKDGSGKDIKADPNFVLRCEVVDITDENAFIGNVVENVHRNATTMVDNYFNQKTLREGQSMSDAAIARLYGHNQAMITRTKKLSAFDTPELQYVLDAVHEGSCTFTAAVTLAEAKDVIDGGPEAVEKVWQKRTEDKEGMFSQSQMLDALKEYRAEVKKAAEEAAKAAGTGEGGEGAAGTGEGAAGTTGTGEGAAGTTGEGAGTAGKTYTRSHKELRDIYRNMIGGKRTPESVIEFSKVHLDIIGGKYTAQEYAEYLCNLLGVEPLTDDEMNAREAERAKTAEAEAAAKKAEADAAKAKPATSGTVVDPGTMTSEPAAPVAPAEPATANEAGERDANNAPKKKGKGAKAKAGK